MASTVIITTVMVHTAMVTKANLLAATLATSSVGARLDLPAGDAAEGNAYSYYYFKDQRRLKLDTTRVAVLRAPDGKEARAEPDLSHLGPANELARRPEVTFAEPDMMVTQLLLLRPERGRPPRAERVERDQSVENHPFG